MSKTDRDKAVLKSALQYCDYIESIKDSDKPVSEYNYCLTCCLSSIRSALQEPVVDVEGLKWNDYDKESDKDYYQAMGWNNCIEHLNKQGYLRTPAQEVGANDHQKHGRPNHDNLIRILDGLIDTAEYGFPSQVYPTQAELLFIRECVEQSKLYQNSTPAQEWQGVEYTEKLEKALTNIRKRCFDDSEWGVYIDRVLEKPKGASE